MKIETTPELRHLIRNARFIMTFAELAVEDMEIPYTANKIERLTGVDLQKAQTYVDDALVIRRTQKHTHNSSSQIRKQKILLCGVINFLCLLLCYFLAESVSVD